MSNTKEIIKSTTNDGMSFVECKVMSFVECKVTLVMKAFPIIFAKILSSGGNLSMMNISPRCYSGLNPQSNVP
jgi:hypothetical protein